MAPTIGALPVLKALEDCGHYSHTVEPFIDQFYQLPGRLVASGGSIEALQRLYVETNPLVTGFSASLLVAALCLIVSEINRNYSQIDRLWSILPNLHVLHLALWARMAGLPHARIDLVAIFSTAWSVSGLSDTSLRLLTVSSFLTDELSRFVSRTTIGAGGVTRSDRKTTAGT